MSRRARTRRDRRDPIPDFDDRPEARIRGDFAGCHYWRGLHLWAILARRRAQSILGYLGPRGQASLRDWTSAACP